MTLYKWSRTAASNATADGTVNYAEGQAPSSLNDSARAAMAAVAKYRDDVAGAITTGGTSTAYTVTSYQVFNTLANMNGHVVAFVPHATNGATVTLNVDGLGAKPLRSAPSTELVAGTLVQGTPYTCTYNSSDAVFYLRDFYVNPYVIPIGAFLDYSGTTAPNSAFVLPYGQAISRTTYATYFSLVSTTFGTGDGSTTFNVPDLRGRVVAGKDDMGGSAASRLTSTYFGTSAATLGNTGGSESNTLSLAKLPTGITSSGSNSITVSTESSRPYPTTSGGETVSTVPVTSTGSLKAPYATGGSGWFGATTMSGSNSISVTSSNTSGEAHANVQPTIILSKILRII